MVNNNDVLSQFLNQYIKPILVEVIDNKFKEYIPPPQPEPEDKRFISRKQAAKKLGICLAKLDQLAKAGDLKRYRNGGIVRFLETDIDTFLTTFQKGKRNLPIPI